jgi:DNA recombination protein RmuC
MHDLAWFWVITFAGVMIFFWFYWRLRSNYDELHLKWIKLAAQHEALVQTSQHHHDDYQRQHKMWQQMLDAKQAEVRHLAESLAASTTANEHIQATQHEKMALLMHAKTALHEAFQQTAQALLLDNAQKMAETMVLKNEQILQPLQQGLAYFDQTLRDHQTEAMNQRVALLSELSLLRDLNQSLGVEAHSLTQALAGQHKTQGIWGEMILSRILEASGLQEGREYTLQTMHHRINDEGDTKRYQPDVIIHLPAKKHLVIDAKVSLNAYQRSIQAIAVDEKKQHLQAHVKAIRQHILSLSAKQYQDLHGLDTVDFVFLFIPIEPAYMAALSEDEQLFVDAFDRRIMLVCPSTLMASLRTIDSLWRYERQNDHALEIAEQGRKLYEKVCGFLNSFEQIGKQLERSQEAYDKAKQQLSHGPGNIIMQTQKLAQLGVKSHKKMPDHYSQLEL